MGFLQNNFGFVQNDWQKTTEPENFAVYKCTIMISSPQRLIALENFGGFINTFKANLFFAQQDYL